MRLHETLAIGLASCLSGVGCASDDAHQVAGIEALVREEGGRSWLILRNTAGREITAVEFDPRTGREYLATQRLFGFTAPEMLAMEDRGERDQIPPQCFQAAQLWQKEYAQYLHSSREREVLKRQSEILAICLDVIGHPSDGSGAFSDAHSDGCTASPDFNFRSCCVNHDRCYAVGGTSDDRKRCDSLMRECIKASGHPFLAEIYYAAARAFGWVNFARR